MRDIHGRHRPSSWSNFEKSRAARSEWPNHGPRKDSTKDDVEQKVRSARATRTPHAVLAESAHIPRQELGIPRSNCWRNFREICGAIPRTLEGLRPALRPLRRRDSPHNPRALVHGSGLCRRTRQADIPLRFAPRAGSPAWLHSFATCFPQPRIGLRSADFPGEDWSDSPSRRPSTRPLTATCRSSKHAPMSQMHGIGFPWRDSWARCQHNAACSRRTVQCFLERSVKKPAISRSGSNLPTLFHPAEIKRDVDGPSSGKLDGYLRRREVEPGSEPTTSVGRECLRLRRIRRQNGTTAWRKVNDERSLESCCVFRQEGRDG